MELQVYLELVYMVSFTTEGYSGERVPTIKQFPCVREVGNNHTLLHVFTAKVGIVPIQSLYIVPLPFTMSCARHNTSTLSPPVPHSSSIAGGKQVWSTVLQTLQCDRIHTNKIIVECEWSSGIRYWESLARLLKGQVLASPYYMKVEGCYCLVMGHLFIMWK